MRHIKYSAIAPSERSGLVHSVAIAPSSYDGQGEVDAAAVASAAGVRFRRKPAPHVLVSGAVALTLALGLAIVGVVALLGQVGEEPLESTAAGGSGHQIPRIAISKEDPTQWGYKILLAHTTRSNNNRAPPKV